MALPTMSIPILIAKADTNVPRKKTTFAVTIIGLRPNMSEILAHTGVELAAPRR